MEDDPLAVVLESAEMAYRHLRRGGLEDDLIFDAVRMCLVEIGNAVSAVPAGVRAAAPEVEWDVFASLPDRVAARQPGAIDLLVEVTEDHLPLLCDVAERLLGA